MLNAELEASQLEPGRVNVPSCAQELPRVLQGCKAVVVDNHCGLLFEEGGIH